MTNYELIKLGKDLSIQNKELYSRVAAFLGKNPEDISEIFMQQFDKIRGDVASAIPMEIVKYNKAKALEKTKNKKGESYIDPHAPQLSEEQETELLNHSGLLMLGEGVIKIPENLLIRALMLIRSSAITILEGRESTVMGISSEQKAAEEGERRTTLLNNFKRRKK